MSGQPNTYFQDYRAKLHAMFRTNAEEIRFEANEWWERERLEKTNRAAFRLGTSDRYQREFLSLWELFDEPHKFRECLDVLTEKARTIRPFTTVVTCTATAKYMLELLHSGLETELERVRIQYLPVHPFLSADRKALLNFEGQKVLVFTDVIASGSLARHMSATVTQLGGTVVGVLAVAVVGEDLLSVATRENDYLEIPRYPDEADSKETIPIHFLADFGIKSLEPHEYDKNKVIKIDPYSVYPEEATFRLNGVPTAFGLQEMYSQWEESGAIAYDFFEADRSPYMTGLRVDRLFSNFGDKIWENIRDRFVDAPDDLGGPVRLVCTFKSGDTLFKEFVIDHLGQEKREVKTCYLHPRHDVESTDYFFVPDSTRNQIEDQPVVLLLSSVSSSQTLREIVSILASCRVRRITVVVLINRMGPGTCDFIDRIRTIFSGWRSKPNKEGLDAPFKFYAVYSINDLSPAQIGRLQDALTTLFDYYESTTEIPSFRSATEQVRKYFQSQQVSTWEFAQGVPRTLPNYSLDVLDGHGKSNVKVSTLEGRFSLLSHALVTNDDYDAVIEQINHLSDRKALYKLFALLLLDLSHLRLTGQFEDLRSCMLNRIASERARRFQMEQDNPSSEDLPSEINEIIDTETTLFLGMALMSYLDHTHVDHLQVATQALTGGKTVEEWIQTPRNMLQHLSEERVAWVTSMLIRLAPSNPDSIADQEALVSQIRKLQKFLAATQLELFLPRDKDGKKITLSKVRRSIRGMIRRAKDNLDMLLTECGEHKTTTYDSCVRFLHSHLISTRQHHSPLVTSLNSVCNALDLAFRDAKGREEASGKTVNPQQPLRCAIPELQAKVEEAIHSVGIVEQIADAASFLFRFTPTSPNHALRYLEPSRPNSMRSDLRLMRGWLLDVRRLNAVSSEVVTNLIRIRNSVFDDLYNDQKLLRRTSRRYLVCLDDALLEAAEYAKGLFKRRAYKSAYDKIIEELTAADREKNSVLVDPGLAREVLRNIMTNLRYTLKGLKLDKEDYPDLVKISIDPETSGSLDGDLTEMISLRVACQGNAFDEEAFHKNVSGSTWELHKHRVSQFGGSLEIGPGNEFEGCQFQLKLYSRNRQARVLARPNLDNGSDE